MVALSIWTSKARLLGEVGKEAKIKVTLKITSEMSIRK